ncbi:MAG: hypothetical protein K0R29_594 [Pseudobdellovibrio sp.]|nr:hypothetical protein [Pseudobdellovibrio sp.]
MKIVETAKQTQVTENETSVPSLEFSDVVVYNEMADQTSVKLNLIEQIRSQLNQLEEMNQKRQFLMKEILDVIR